MGERVGGPRWPPEPVSLPVRSERDIVGARQRGRALAAQQGFSSGDQALIAATISEVARNIVQYAREGVIDLRVVTYEDSIGIRIVARDRGPGIPDVRLALQDGYSTSRGLGLGLPGVVRAVDEFLIESKPEGGTTVTVTKWSNHGGPWAAERASGQARQNEPADPDGRLRPREIERPGERPAPFSIPTGLWFWLDKLCWRN